VRIKLLGLRQTRERIPLVEGLYRARVVHFEPTGHATQPCRAALFLIIDPSEYAGRHVHTRLYCHDRALWKLRWFLKNFASDPEVLTADELDDRRVVGLEGINPLAYCGSDDQQKLDVQGFAPAEWWPDLVPKKALVDENVQPVIPPGAGLLPLVLSNRTLVEGILLGPSTEICGRFCEPLS